MTLVAAQAPWLRLNRVVSADIKTRQSTWLLRKSRYLRLPGEKATHNHGNVWCCFIGNTEDELSRESQTQPAPGSGGTVSFWLPGKQLLR